MPTHEEPSGNSSHPTVLSLKRSRCIRLRSASKMSRWVRTEGNRGEGLVQRKHLVGSTFASVACTSKTCVLKRSVLEIITFYRCPSSAEVGRTEAQILCHGAAPPGVCTLNVSFSQDFLLYISALPVLHNWKLHLFLLC